MRAIDFYEILKTASCELILCCFCLIRACTGNQHTARECLKTIMFRVGGAASYVLAGCLMNMHLAERANKRCPTACKEQNSIGRMEK